MFVITEMDAGCGVHLKAHRAVLRLDRDGAALAAFQDAGKLAHAVGGGADELDADLLALECLVVLRAGQLAAKAGAAHLEIIALVDGVCLIEDGVQRVGHFGTGVGVHGAVPVDEHTEIPVRPFLFKDHIPQAQAHALHDGADKRFDSLGGVAARLLRHKKPPNKQEKRTLRPTFQ